MTSFFGEICVKERFDSSKESSEISPLSWSSASVSSTMDTRDA